MLVSLVGSCLAINSWSLSTQTIGTAVCSRFAANACWVKMADGFASSKIILIRSTGYEGSIGRYPAPALRIASIDTIISSDRSKQTATNESGLRLYLSRIRASWFEHRSSSRYVMQSHPSWIAMLSGVLSTCRSKDRLIVSHWNDATECGFHLAISKLTSAGVIGVAPSMIQLYPGDRYDV